MKSDALNNGIGVILLTLAACAKVDAAVLLLGAWCPIDMYLIHRDRRGTEALRQSLFVHHAITCLLCMQCLLFSVSIEFSYTWLLLEITTTIMCLHNILRNRFAFVLRLILWVLVRGVVTYRLLGMIAEGIAKRDEAILQVAPYAVALLTLSVSWTFRCNANVSCLQFLLVAAVARADFSVGRYFGIFVQIGASYAFYEYGHLRFDHGVQIFNLLRLYWDVSIEASIVVCTLAMSNRTVSSVTTALLSAYTLMKNPTVERVACALVICAYVLCVGPRQLTFGHRIGWHAACTLVMVRSLPTPD